MMASYFDLVRVFGEGNVASLKYEQLRGIGVSPEDARSLADVGLPKHLPPVFTLDVEGEPSVFSVHEFDLGGTAAKILVIGGPPGDAQMRYFLDVNDGLVGIFSLSEESPQVETINSTIHDFIEFLHQIGVHVRRIESVAGEERRPTAEDLRSRLMEQDPPALEVPDSWWSVVVDHLKD